MFGRRRRDLERRVTELEERLDVRRWELPPENHVDIDDLPELADYSTHTGWWDEDDTEGWQRHPSTYGYL